MDDLAQLDELHDLFRHPWDALVLVCLLKGPLRYGQLGNEMQQRSRDRIPDPRINAAINRLTAAGLIAPVTHHRTHAHDLTPMGRTKAQRIQQIITIRDNAGQTTGPPIGT